jgi:hypothetical protein
MPFDRTAFSTVARELLLALEPSLIQRGGAIKAAIGVATWNRKSIVAAHAASLRESRLPVDTKILVIDDASSEYDVEFLASIFPPGSEIRRNQTNSGGADFALANLMKELLKTDADVVMLLDSDLLVHEEFVGVGLGLLDQTDGLLSLFNTPNHPALREVGPFLIKESIGSAGTLWSRELAESVIRDVADGARWDWRFCDHVRSTGREIYVSKQSMVQHVGFAEGQNSKLDYGDFGAGFADSDARNAYRLIEGNVAYVQAIGRRVIWNGIEQSEFRAKLEKALDAGSARQADLGTRLEDLGIGVQSLREEHLRRIEENQKRIEENQELNEKSSARLEDLEARIRSLHEENRANISNFAAQLASLEQRVKICEKRIWSLPYWRLRRALKRVRQFFKRAN